jgi:hypothetical protein
MPRSEGAGAADAAERTPRQKRQAQLGAQLQLVLAGAESGRELVLHRDQPGSEEAVGEADLLLVGVGDPGRLDHAFVNELGERAEGVGVSDLGVGAVMLVETDRLHAEPSRGGFRCFFQVLRPTVERPAAIRRTDVAAFGGDRLLVALLRSVYAAAVQDRLVASSPVTRLSSPRSERAT